MAKLTEKQVQVLGWMQANEGEHFASDIAAGCGLEEKSVRPVLTGLAKATKERTDIYVAVSEGEKEVLDKEAEMIKTEIAADPKNASKPEAIIEKMVVGKLEKFFKEVVLVEQAFIKENKISIEKYVKDNQNYKSVTVQFDFNPMNM